MTCPAAYIVAPLCPGCRLCSLRRWEPVQVFAGAFDIGVFSPVALLEPRSVDGDRQALGTELGAVVLG
jgi:hypothetical protein